MNPQTLTAIIDNLAKATVLLSEAAKNMTITHITIDPDGVHIRHHEADPEFTRDVGFVKNIDILPPVRIDEQEEDIASIFDYIAANKITVQEATDWLYELHGEAAMKMMADGLIPTDHLKAQYAMALIKSRNK